MMIEFEKRLNALESKLSLAEDKHREAQIEISATQAAITEVEHLYNFYKTQMVATGRVKPEEEKDGTVHARVDG